MCKKIIPIYLLVLFSFGKIYSENTNNDKIIEFQTQKFKYILETAIKNHPDSLDLTKISDAAFTAMLQAMDKESNYYSKAILKQVTENNKGVTYGIGLETVNIKDTLFVIQVIPNSPASKAGIEVGDKIVEIEGKSAKGMSKNAADLLIQGDSATTVKIVFQNVYSTDNKEYKIVRSDITRPSLITAFMFLNTDIGVFVLNRFSEKSPVEFKEKAVEFIKFGMKKIIIDLRGNPGGYMTKVDEILDLFIGGSKILSRSVSNNKDFASEIYSKDGDFLEKFPVVVLIDENSASGSELLSGVIQDYDRGIIVGKRSYGKGTVQKIWTMNDTTGFKLTVGKYVTPSGRDIQKYVNNTPIEIESGLNTNINKEEIKNKIKESGGIGNIKFYKSSGGRTIIGGGGVLPDIIVDRDTLTQLTDLLIKSGLYFEWAVMFKQREGKKYLEKYGKNYSKFNREFQINDDILKEFANFALANKVWNNEMFIIDKKYFINYIKASIANVLWGYDAFCDVMSVADNQLISAFKEMPNAEKMISK